MDRRRRGLRDRRLAGVRGLRQATLTIDAAVTAALRGGARGELLEPGTADYEVACGLWNGMIRRRPGAVLRCTGVADVVHGVRIAREHGLRLAVRGGGHNVAGLALCDGGLVLDMSRMRGIHADPRARTARVQAGCTLGDLDHETQLHGLATPSGIATTTGLAGLTLGGGIGWLMRKWGLTCDNLRSAEVVTADGRVLTASEHENADLFWGLRGGGGNFGVVTSFEYRLHALGPQVLCGLVLYPAERGREVIEAYREVIAAAPDELGTGLALRHAPAAPWVPQELHGAPVVVVVAAYAGPPDEGSRVVEPLRGLGPPLLDTIAVTPWRSHQSILDASVPWGARYYWKSHDLGGLDGEVIGTLLSHAWRSPSAASYTVVFRPGGAVSRVAEDATAYSHRDAAHIVNINAEWVDPHEDEAQIAWARDYFAALEPHAIGAYVNFLGNEGEDRVRAAYGAEKYARLVALKDAYDPENFFRVNQNIPPSSPPS